MLSTKTIKLVLEKYNALQVQCIIIISYLLAINDFIPGNTASMYQVKIP